MLEPRDMKYSSKGNSIEQQISIEEPLSVAKCLGNHWIDGLTHALPSPMACG